MRKVIGWCSIVSMMFLNSFALYGEESQPTEVAAKAVMDGVIVHQAADDKSATVATLKKGDPVTASDRKGGYWKVKLPDGKEGFVSVTGLQSKAGINTVKEAVSGAMPSKSAASGKVDDAKAKKDAAVKKGKAAGAHKLEKEANKLFNK